MRNEKWRRKKFGLQLETHSILWKILNSLKIKGFSLFLDAEIAKLNLKKENFRENSELESIPLLKNSIFWVN